MDVDTAAMLLMVVVPILLVIEGIVVLAVWGVRGGGFPWLISSWHDGPRHVPGASVGYWLLFTTLTAAVGWMASFILIHALLFSFGTEAAWAGIVGSVVFMAAMPILWAVIIQLRRHDPYRSPAAARR